MTSLRSFVLFALVSLSTACLNYPTPPSDPASAAVPGNTAQQWDACSHNGDIGRECMQTCREGGQTNGRFECVSGTWRCVVLSAATCSNPNPPPNPPSNPPNMTPPTHPQGRVVVTCGGPERREVLTNTNAVLGRTMGVSAEGRPVVIRRQHARFGDSMATQHGPRGHVQFADSRQYFRNFHMKDIETGETVMGPIALRATSDRRDGDVLFQDREVRVEAGNRRVFSYRFDVAVHEEVYRDFVGGRYTLRLDADSSRALFLGDDLVWGDTREPVSSNDVSYDASCFGTPERFDIRVSARYSSLIVDVDRSQFSSARVSTPSLIGGARYSLLPLIVDNDGAEDGLVDGMDVNVLAQVNGTTPIPFDQIASQCMVTTMRGDRTFGAAIPSGNRVVFRGLAARIAGVSRSQLTVRCNYSWPSSADGNEIELRAGIQWTSFTMVSLGDQGEIQGTLNLQDNIRANNTSAVTVTLER